MRKLINNPDDLSTELIDGFVLAYKDRVKRIGPHVVARSSAPIEGQVGVVIGGGAGHEPMFLEFIGKGLADVSVHGEIFTAPAPDDVHQAIKAADGGSGVLLLYNNYAGDVLNFNIGQEEARNQGINVETVLINDEISAFPKEQMDERRGTSCDTLVIHVAGAAAQSDMDLSSLVALLKKTVFNCRSIAVATAPCTLPQTGLPTFELPDGRMELGMGLHGEAGVHQVEIMTANETAELLIDQIVLDLPFKEGDEVVALISGYGQTTRMEMFLVMRRLHSYLEEKGIAIYDSVLGEFNTAQEMGGISMTLMKVDDEIKKYHDMPANGPGFVKF